MRLYEDDFNYDDDYDPLIEGIPGTFTGNIYECEPEPDDDDLWEDEY